MSENYDKDKHLASNCLLEAFALAREAYFRDPTQINMAAFHACEAAVKAMINPYFMKLEERERKETS